MRKSKKLMLSLLAMSMVMTTAVPVGIPGVSAGTVSVYAATASQGKCGDSATYKYDEDTKTLTISGTGDMWDDYGFSKVFTSTEKIVIENGIQTIGSYSFQKLYNVKSVSIAESVNTIKEYAFSQILGTVEIPKSVTRIEENAFSGAEGFVIKGDVKGYGVSALGHVYIDEIVLHGAAQDLGKVLYDSIVGTVTIAEDNTKCKVSNGCLLSADGKELYYCISSRGKITIPDSVEVIDTAACCDKKIKELTLGKNVKTISDYAFEGAKIGTINVNKNLTTVGIKAFYNTKIKNVNFSSKVKLGVSSFNNKVNIKYSVKFKKSQTTIDTASVGKSKYNIKFAKVSGATGYQIKVKNGKKTYTYSTKSNSYTKNAPKALTKEYSVEKNYLIGEDEYLTDPEGSAYVRVRPYKTEKGKTTYGRWSKKTVLSYSK